MNTINKSIQQVFTALLELEAKGYHRFYFECGNGLFRAIIYSGENIAEKIMYERTINIVQEQAELEHFSNLIETLKNRVHTTIFQCYRQDFVKGEKSGEWKKIKPVFEVGENATEAMLIDGSGYYINDPDNSFLYFVDMKQVSETN
jgi:hypothetical protein